MSDNAICEYCGGKIIDYGIERECENADFSPFGKKGTCPRPKISVRAEASDLSIRKILSYADEYECDDAAGAAAIRQMVKNLTAS